MRNLIDTPLFRIMLCFGYFNVDYVQTKVSEYIPETCLKIDTYD
jgi:hypothetical protein